MDSLLDTTQATLNGWRFELLNGFQRDFPLDARPYRVIAERLGLDEATVLDTLGEWQREGVVSRVGAVFRPNTVGRSTLAALAVPPERLQEVAEQVSAWPQVNHNYEREHGYNLWFVVAANSQRDLNATLLHIREQTGLTPLSLPLVRDYHIDLGFDLRHGMAPRAAMPRIQIDPTPLQRLLLAELHKGLPLVQTPYRHLAFATGQSEAFILGQLDAWQRMGVIRRMGLVLRHRELGYTANAMAVWDVPDEQVDEIGARLSTQPGVTLCYRRRRSLPDWHYNLFCMVHGQDRTRVAGLIDELSRRLDLGSYAHAVLFSRQRFKQCGARYG